jgi:hypothetical protein
MLRKHAFPRAVPLRSEHALRLRRMPLSGLPKSLAGPDNASNLFFFNHRQSLFSFSVFGPGPAFSLYGSPGFPPAGLGRSHVNIPTLILAAIAVLMVASA